jgi:type VI secretion system protein ImpA
MSDAQAFSIDELLRPLDEPGPAGIRLRTSDTVHPELRELMSRAKKALESEKKASDAGNDPSVAGMGDWSTVKELGEKLLSSTAKDLDVAALMVAAAVRTDGLAGLVGGLELVAGLVDRFWPDIFAAARAAAEAEGGPVDEEQIVLDLTKMIDQWKSGLPGPISWIPLTEGSDAGSYALWQYEQAVQAEKLSPEEREKRKASTIARLMQSAAQTAQRNRSYFPQLMTQLEEVSAKSSQLESAFQKHLSNGLQGLAPSLIRVRERVDDIKRCLTHIAKDYLTPPAQAASVTGTAAGGSPLAQGPAGEPQGREEAFRQLSQIADFFARTEPLSLLAEQIRQVVKRGRSSPEKYYAELIDNEDSLRQFFRLVGIKPAQDESSDGSN